MNNMKNYELRFINALISKCEELDWMLSYDGCGIIYNAIIGNFFIKVRCAEYDEFPPDVRLCTHSIISKDLLEYIISSDDVRDIDMHILASKLKSMNITKTLREHVFNGCTNMLWNNDNNLI